MIKNNPYPLLKKSGIAKNLLSANTKKALTIYDETLADLKEFPGNTSLVEMAEKIAMTASELLAEDITQIQTELKGEAEEAETKQKRKAQSKKIVEKSNKAIDYLSECRAKLRADRKKKIASGEIKAPIKKQLTTKLKESMKKIVNMMPKAIKKDKKKIDRTEKAIQEFLSDLKRIWGMNKIKPIEKELKEKFNQLKEKAD